MKAGYRKARREYFDGVNSAFHLWCNFQALLRSVTAGQPLPSEFDLSILRAEKTAAVMVLRWVTADYLERSGYVADERHFFRDVSLLHKPNAHKSLDFHVATRF